MEDKQQSIHEKGFSMSNTYSLGGPGDSETTYNKIKVGLKTLEDAVIGLSPMEKTSNSIANKDNILKALSDNDSNTLREVSEYFYRTSGIYQKICNYFAFLYRYDWYIVPEILDKKVKNEKILVDFNNMLRYLDKSNIKQMCGDIALQVIKNGVYYGYLADTNGQITIQELPVKYCRSRFKVGTNPVLEFNMKYFDDNFKDTNYRMKVLNLFPKEFAKGYLLYKQGKLQPDFQGDQNGWYLLEPENTVKFSFYSSQSDVPYFVNAIPAIIDLDRAQDLDRRKQMQKLLKILVQKLPRDKNGDLIFDVDEARDLHNNAVEMLQKAIGVDVLTTFADVESIDMSDRNSATTSDDLEKVERSVYNAIGSAQNLFNPKGNLSLEKSILQDEASVRNLILQFNDFFERAIDKKNTQRKKYLFHFSMLNTTQYNFKELSKMYKEQTQLGYSKMLPQLALGHSQSSIINSAYFENEVLKLHEIMIPNLMSSTMSAGQILDNKGKDKKENTQNKTEGKIKVEETKEAGRPEKPDDQKSEKTIANKESMS